MTATELIDKCRPSMVAWQNDDPGKCVFAVAEEIKDSKLQDNAFAIQGTELGLANLFYHILRANPQLAKPIRFALEKAAVDSSIEEMVRFMNHK